MQIQGNGSPKCPSRRSHAARKLIWRWADARHQTSTFDWGVSPHRPSVADCYIQKHTLDMIITPDCLCSELLDSDRMDDKFQREVLERLKAMEERLAALATRQERPPEAY